LLLREHPKVKSLPIKSKAGSVSIVSKTQEKQELSMTDGQQVNCNTLTWGIPVETND
jgi:hypothetical protein